MLASKLCQLDTRRNGVTTRPGIPPETVWPSCISDAEARGRAEKIVRLGTLGSTVGVIRLRISVGKSLLYHLPLILGKPRGRETNLFSFASSQLKEATFSLLYVVKPARRSGHHMFYGFNALNTGDFIFHLV